jgi:nucleoside-diphosphate-sugar epimerase
MNILITGANGYIGQRLIPVLLNEGHRLYCCVRNKQRFEDEHDHTEVEVIEIDFLADSNTTFPVDIDIAFYLIHSMSGGGNFEELEAKTAEKFKSLITSTQCRQIIYLGSAH